MGPNAAKDASCPYSRDFDGSGVEAYSSPYAAPYLAYRRHRNFTSDKAPFRTRSQRVLLTCPFSRPTRPLLRPARSRALPPSPARYVNLPIKSSHRPSPSMVARFMSSKAPPSRLSLSRHETTHADPYCRRPRERADPEG